MRFRSSGPRTWALVIIFSFAVFATPLVAQSGTARLRGQVTDPSGAVVPGATIYVKNASGLLVATKADGLGGYDVRNLAPGKYTVSASAKGFSPLVQEVLLAAGQDKKLDIALEILVKEETVDVQGDANRVSTSSDNNASMVVLTGKDLDALSDDPDELQSELQALAGPSAGPNGGQIYIDGFTGGTLPPKSSIREIRINQNPFSAQYDRMGFGRIEILTKPGTDKLHGQFSFNDNHSFMDALNPFAINEPAFDTQSFSGNIGGPLSKKASFQVNIEQRNIHDAAVIDGSAFTNANIPIVGVLNPRIRTNISTRLDYQLAARNTLMVRYQFTHNHEENDGIAGLTLPSQAFNQTGNEHTIQISDTQVLSAKAINETRFEWQRNSTAQNALNSGPSISVLGLFTEGGNPLGTSAITTNHYELQNYTSLNFGNHFLRLGGRLRATAETSISTQNFNGSYTFVSLAAFQAGTPRQLSLATGNPQITNTFVDAGLYAEDDWKVRPNMTLSYGLRFETQNGIHDHADWAPRVSFAWAVGAKKNTQPKTVIKTGFGIFYDRFGQAQILTAERFNGLNEKQFVIFNPSYPNLPSVATLAAAPSTLYGINPTLRAPYNMQAVIGMDRQLSKTATVSVNYLHTRGVHQLYSTVLNPGVLLPVQGPQYQFESGGVYTQNQLIANANWRLGTRLTLFGYYVLSYANSNTGGASSFASNPLLGISADYGRAPFDVRNRVFLGGTVSLPHGFRVSPLLVANGGAPFNITTGGDVNGDSIFNDRPALASVAPGAAAASCAAATPSAPVCTPTGFAALNLFPGANVPRIPINFGNSPGQFTLNMRLSKTIGIGPKIEATNGPTPQRGGGARPPTGGAPAGGPRGPGGPMGGGPERSNQRYSLTFSVNARNIFNNVNPAPPIGNLSSSLFDHSTALAGGVFNTQSANRRIDLQVGFSF